MKINSKVLGLIVLLTFVGGIALSSALGYWSTESSGGAGAGTGTGEGAGTTVTEDTLVRGKTTFQDLLNLGLAPETIEEVIGGPLPDPLTRVKDHCAAAGLDFETVKTALEAEILKLDR